MELFKKSVYEAGPVGYCFIFLIALVLCGFLLLSLQPPSSLMGFCMGAVTVTSAALKYSVSSFTSNRKISGTVNKEPPSGRRGFVFRAPR